MFKHSLEQQSLAKQPSQLLHRDPLHLPHITVRSINDTRYGTLCTNVNMVGAYDTFKCEHIGGLQKHYRPNFILETGLLCHILLTSQDFQPPQLQMTLLYNKYPQSEPTNNLAVQLSPCEENPDA